MVLRESNLRKSFEKVRMDMIEIKNEILTLAEDQKELRDMVLKSRRNPSKSKRK